MANPGKILAIARMAHEVSKKVKDPFDPKVRDLILNMEATVNYTNCSGLAAPQVFSSLQIIIFRVEKSK